MSEYSKPGCISYFMETKRDSSIAPSTSSAASSDLTRASFLLTPSSSFPLFPLELTKTRTRAHARHQKPNRNKPGQVRSGQIGSPPDHHQTTASLTVPGLLSFFPSFPLSPLFFLLSFSGSIRKEQRGRRPGHPGQVAKTSKEGNLVRR